MAKKATVKPRKKMPPRFLVTNLAGQHYASGASEVGAVDHGVKLFGSRNYGSRIEGVGIYRLIKILRPRETPVEVEEVSCCEDAK